VSRYDWRRQDRLDTRRQRAHAATVECPARVPRYLLLHHRLRGEHPDGCPCGVDHQLGACPACHRVCRPGVACH